MRQRDWWGLAAVAMVWVLLVVYRQYFLEPREWGTVCVAAAPPLACVPRSGLIWLQRYYLLGGISLGLGLWGFAWAGRVVGGAFAAQLGAVLIGIAAIENYNATWGAIGLALGAWGWLRRDGWR